MNQVECIVCGKPITFITRKGDRIPIDLGMVNSYRGRWNHWPRFKQLPQKKFFRFIHKHKCMEEAL